MNWGALIKNVVAGAVTGFLAIAGANTFYNTGIHGWEAAGTAALMGALRAVQEYLTPTSYIREPVTPTAKKLAAKPK